MTSALNKESFCDVNRVRTQEEKPEGANIPEAALGSGSEDSATRDFFDGGEGAEKDHGKR